MGDVQTRILKHILLRMAVALAYLFNTPNDQVVKCRISTFWLSLFHRYKKNGYIHICILYICSLHLLCCDIMRPLFCACLSFACNDTLLDGNTKSKNMTMIYCIRDSRFINPPPILKPCSPGFEAPCCARRPVLSMRFSRDCRRRDFCILCAYDSRSRSGTCRDPGRFRAPFGRKKTGCLPRHPVFSFRPRDYFFSVRVMRFSLMRAFLPVRSRR